MKKTIFLLPVGILLMVLSVKGMAHVNAQYEYTSDFYQNMSFEIRSVEESIFDDHLTGESLVEHQAADSEVPEEDVVYDSEDNSAIYGDYLYINDTDICYPLVQGEDNQYYLNHLPDGRKSTSGSIFMDYQNSFPEDFNVIIYGHNMRNGTMFAQLYNYYNYKNYAENHNQLIIFYDGIRCVYELFSVMRAEYDSDVYKINPDDKEQWIDSQKLHSVVNLESEAKSDDKFVTLSTCGKSNTEKVITVWKKLSEE